MKLLLDEMHAPAIAIALRKAEHDVVAAAEGPMRALDDVGILAEGALQGRAVVTENISDFRIIAADWAQTGRVHAGIIYTPRQRFPRGASSYPRNLIRALRGLLEAPPVLTKGDSWEWWLGTPYEVT